MRVPLLRSGQDDRSIAWWELLFIPIMAPLVLLFKGDAESVFLPPDEKSSNDASPYH